MEDLAVGVVGSMGRLIFEASLDGDGDMQIYDSEDQLVSWISRDDAQAIVNHLTAVFGLGEK